MSDFKKEIVEIRKKLEDKFNKKYDVKSMVSIEATTLDDLYFKIMDKALKYGRVNFVDEGSFKGQHRLEFDYVALNVKYPTTRPLAPQPRPGVIVTTNDSNIEEYAKNYLLNGSMKNKPNEHYSYASWITGIPKDEPLESRGISKGTRLNQLEWCANHFVEKGYGNNHCYLTVGCAEGLQRYDWEDEDKSKGIPKKNREKGSTECLRGLDLKIRDNKLNLACVFRSWDLVAGLPENLGGLTIFMEKAVDMINLIKYANGKDLPDVEPGVLYGSSHGLHIYEEYLDMAKLWVGLEETKNSW